VKGVEELQEGRGLGNKKINRVNLSLDNKTNRKLNQLAVACGMKPTVLARHILEKCLDDPLFVTKLQQEHNVHAAYKVLPINRNGETEYMFRG
jgi:hypothetical protein